MKKLLVFAVSTAMIAFASCDKVKDLIKFNVGVQSQDVTFTIPPIQDAGENELSAANVHLNIDSIIKAENEKAGVGNIKSAKVTDVTIVIENPDADNNFAVIENGKVTLSSNVKTDVVTIAEISGNPDEYKASLTLPVNGDVDLADYLKGTEFTYKLSAKTRRGTTIELNCKATIKYDLVVGLE